MNNEGIENRTIVANFTIIAQAITPKSLDLLTEFSVDICTIILLVKKLPMKSPTESLHR